MHELDYLGTRPSEQQEVAAVRQSLGKASIDGSGTRCTNQRSSTVVDARNKRTGADARSFLAAVNQTVPDQDQKMLGNKR